ncbi:MAG: alpha/beta hydrolase [Thaumarchaeota archaeon]|nr:alpha/beta hydrolase [Nitrososphaerota archaeon]
MQENHVLVNGNKIRYLEHGDSKDAIVLLHGLGGMAERWLATVPFLSKGYRVIAPDLIGYGKSDKPRVDYTPDLFRETILGLLDTLSLHDVAMIGTSLGGEIVAECAATQNFRIKKIIMVSPAGVMKKSTPVLDAYTMAALHPTRESVRTAYQMMIGGDMEISDQSVENFIANMSNPNARTVFLSTLLGMKNAPAITDKLHLIRVPALLVWGSGDKMIPVEYSKDFASSISDCQVAIMEGCGHIPYEERPSEFSKLVLDFLTKQDKS